MTHPASIHLYRAPPNLLAGRVILVTGAGDGLGSAAALAYARHGAAVILLGRTQKKLEAIYDQIEQEKLAAPLLMPVDLARAGLQEFDEIAAAIGQQFGRLDGLLHSAARLGTLTPLHLYDLNTWTQVMQVNLNAPHLLTRACLDILNRAPEASVIFSSSDVARAGRAYWGAYAAAGAALERLMQIWADENRTHSKIRFNTLDPGNVRTALRAHAYPGEDPASLPLPESVMPAYLYLMGPASHGISGQAIRAQPE